ncbi:MAG TPA: Arc family DNA-binding protein [Calditrichia bacterium]|nr:Arc family DNA-binding protein [Calditrichota bacterium]HQV32614.1 Arc family DNA-binding protein [Calditrichia bacterium]
MNITVRNIPEDILKKIRTLSRLGRRSMNNEILTLLEESVQERLEKLSAGNNRVTMETQVAIWEKLAGEWEDDRTTEEIIRDIYDSRTLGRDIEL